MESKIDEKLRVFEDVTQSLTKAAEGSLEKSTEWQNKWEKENWLSGLEDWPFCCKIGNSTVANKKIIGDYLDNNDTDNNITKYNGCHYFAGINSRVFR